MRETYSDLGFEPDVESLVRSTAAAYGVDPDLAVRVAKQESGFKQSAQSKKGATGVMQLMPGTAKNLGVDPHDLQQNIEGGVRYLKTQLDAFGGDVPKALAAYNWGPGNVRKGGSPPKETVDYVKAITGADYPYAPAAPYSDLGFEPETTPTVAPIAAPAVASPHADLGFEPEGGAAPAVEQPSTGQPAPAFEGPIPSLEEIQAADADLKQRADAITQRAVALDQEQAQLEAEGAQLTDLLRRSQILPVGPRDEGEREILVAQFNEKIAAHNAARQQLQAEVEQFNSSLAQLQAGVAAFNENVKRWSSLTVPPGAEKTGLPGIPGPQIPMAYDPLGDNPERVQQWGRIGKMLRPIDTLMRAGSAAVMGTIGGTVGAPLQIIGRELEGRAPGTVIGKAGEAIRDIGEEVSEFARRGTQIRPEDAAKLSASWIENPLLLLDPDYIAHQAGMAGGSILSFLLPTMGVLSKMQKASALTKTAAGVGGASFLESLTNAGQNYDEAIDRGADPKTAAQVFVTTLKRDFPVTAGLNVLGLFNPAIKSKPVRVAASTLTEPVQEVAQGAIQRQTMKEQVDPSIDIREGMDVEALGGLIGGAIGGAVLPESATRAPERAPQPVSMPPSPAPTPARPRVRPAAKPAAQPIETPSPGARAAAQPVEYNEGDQFRGKAGVYRVTQITENEVSYELTNRAGKKRMASMPVDDFERFVRRAEKITDAQPQRVETEPAGKPASARAGEDAGAAAAGKFSEEIRKKSGKLPEESATEPAAGVEAPAFKPGDRVEWTINGQRRTGTIIEAAPEAFGLEGKWQVQVDGVQGPRGRIRSVDAEILKPLAVEPEAQAAPIPATKSDSIEEAERKPASAPEAAAATETPAAPAAAPQSERGAQDKGSQVEIDLREPWQMTWDDFRKVTAKLPRGPVSEEAATRLLRQQHREIIEKALDEGKPVPDEVLKDYPDLAKAAQAAEPASAAPRALSAGEATKPAENIPENIPAEKPNYDYASTQVNLPEGVAANVLKESKKIADEDLADDGRETEPHVTVLYGLHGEDPESVRKLLADEPPVRVTLGKTSIFPDDGERGSDVVKIDVESEDLARLNKKLADALPHTITHPGYKPHVTLAYVKPGKGKKYAGANDLEGQEIVIDRVVFSDRAGKQTVIRLGGKAPERTGTAAESERPKYPDGRLIPVEGEEVYQTVRGLGGTPAYVYGKVEKGKGDQLRVRITGGASMMGGSVKGVGGTQALDRSWTVKNDPEVKRREQARADEQKARQEAREREEQEDREKRQAFIDQYGETRPSDVEPGDILEDYQGRRATARKIADGEVYAHEAGEDEKTAPVYFPGPFRKTGEKAGPDYWRGQLANARANLKSLRDEVPTATELIAEREAEVKLAERKLGEAMRAAGKEEKGPEAAEGTAKTTDNISPESKESAQLALTGDTYRYRNLLRKLGAKWNGDEKAWIIDASRLPEVQKISDRITWHRFGETTPAASAEAEPTAEPAPRPTQPAGRISAEQVSRFNSYTQYPTTVEKQNADLAKFWNDLEDQTTAKLKKWGVTEIPADVRETMERMYQERINDFDAQVRSREVAPPWTVTGRSNYQGDPERANRILEKQAEATQAAREHYNRVLRQYDPNRPVSSDEADAPARLRKKIEDAEKLQTLMKRANSIVRMKATDEVKIEQLQKLGLSRTRAEELLKPDFMGRKGFPDYALANNNANIKRMKERLARIEQGRTEEGFEAEFDGGRVVDSVADNRLQIFFDEKPGPELREKLKRNGFKWAPSVGAWQRMRGDAARRSAEAVLGVKLTPAGQVKVEATPAPPPAMEAKPAEPEKPIVPAEAPKSTPIPAPVEEIPERVKARVKTALEQLHSIATTLGDARKADEKFGGEGRYEYEAWSNIPDREQRIRGAEELLALFRKIATGKGINPETLINELGGVPEYRLSRKAREWGGEAPDMAEIETKLTLAHSDMLKAKANYERLQGLLDIVTRIGTPTPAEQEALDDSEFGSLRRAEQEDAIRKALILAARKYDAQRTEYDRAQEEAAKYNPMLQAQSEVALPHIEIPVDEAADSNLKASTDAVNDKISEILDAEKAYHEESVRELLPDLQRDLKYLEADIAELEHASPDIMGAAVEVRDQARKLIERIGAEDYAPPLPELPDSPKVEVVSAWLKEHRVPGVTDMDEVATYGDHAVYPLKDGRLVWVSNTLDPEKPGVILRQRLVAVSPMDEDLRPDFKRREDLRNKLEDAVEDGEMRPEARDRIMKMFERPEPIPAPIEMVEQAAERLAELPTAEGAETLERIAEQQAEAQAEVATPTNEIAKIAARRPVEPTMADVEAMQKDGLTRAQARTVEYQDGYRSYDNLRKGKEGLKILEVFDPYAWTWLPAGEYKPAMPGAYANAYGYRMKKPLFEYADEKLIASYPHVRPGPLTQGDLDEATRAFDIDNPGITIPMPKSVRAAMEKMGEIFAERPLWTFRKEQIFSAHDQLAQWRRLYERSKEWKDLFTGPLQTILYQARADRDWIGEERRRQAQLQALADRMPESATMADVQQAAEKDLGVDESLSAYKDGWRVVKHAYKGVQPKFTLQRFDPTTWQWDSDWDAHSVSKTKAMEAFRASSKNEPLTEEKLQEAVKEVWESLSIHNKKKRTPEQIKAEERKQALPDRKPDMSKPFTYEVQGEGVRFYLNFPNGEKWGPSEWRSNVFGRRPIIDAWDGPKLDEQQAKSFAVARWWDANLDVLRKQRIFSGEPYDKRVRELRDMAASILAPAGRPRVIATRKEGDFTREYSVIPTIRSDERIEYEVRYRTAGGDWETERYSYRGYSADYDTYDKAIEAWLDGEQENIEKYEFFDPVAKAIAADIEKTNRLKMGMAELAKRKKATERKGEYASLPQKVSLELPNQTAKRIIQVLKRMTAAAKNIPVLQNVAIITRKGKTQITATDLKTAVTFTLEDVVSSGDSATTVPLSAIETALKAKSKDPLKIEADEGKATVSVGGAETVTETLSILNYPEPPETPTKFGTIPADDLLDAIRVTVPSISKEENRFTLNGALVEIKDGAATMVATDGHRLTLHTFKTPGIKGEQPLLLINRSSLDTITKAFAKEKDSLALKFDKDEEGEVRHISVENTDGSVKVVMRKMEGSFPDYSRVIPDPKSFTHKATVNREALLGLMQQVIALKGKPNVVALSFRDGQLVGFAQANEKTAKGKIAATLERINSEETEPGNPRMAMNAHYLADFLKSIDADQVEIFIKEPEEKGAVHTNVQVQPAGDPSSISIIMPMRDAELDFDDGLPAPPAADEIPVNARLDYEAPLGEAQLPGFYSQLERVIEQKMPPRATVQQALAILRNPQNGVKRDELDWTGVETFLKERTGSVSKQELLDFVRANRVEIEEVVLGVPRGPITYRTARGEFDLPVHVAENAGTGARIQELPSGRFSLRTDSGLTSLHDTLEEAKGEVAQIRRNVAGDTTPTKYGSQYTLPGGTNHREFVFIAPQAEPWGERDTQHYGDTGQGRAIGWARVNDRVGPKGERILHIEEIQSKRGADARKLGLKPEGPIPPAPLLNTFDQFAIKRLLRYAVENNYDAITWTTGEQQAERYDLSTRISRVEYLPESTKLRAFDLDGRAVLDKVVSSNELEEYIGKDLAQKLLSSTPQTTRDGKPVLSIEAEGLKIGGESLKVLYDVKLPSFVAKYTKKWGGKVDTTEIGTRPGESATVHHLAITPAMRESVMAGQPLFALSWEAIDAAPDLGTIGKNARTATARYKSRPGGGVLWLNFEGAYLINVASRHNPNLVFRGLHASRASARQIAERLRAMAENLESTAERAGIWRVASALERAAEDGESIIMAQTGATSIKRLKSTLRHERFHAQQAELGRGGEEGWKHVNPAALLVHPIARKALQRLYQRGYAKATDEYKAHALAMEIGAHLAEGPLGWESIGLNRDEARELFRHYANLLLDMHGEDLPTKLSGLAPQWNKELENVRREKGTHLRPGRYGADREVGPGPTGWDVRQGIRPALPGEQASLPEDPGERRKAVESSRVPSERGAGEQIPSTKTPQTPGGEQVDFDQLAASVARFGWASKRDISEALRQRGLLDPSGKNVGLLREAIARRKQRLDAEREEREYARIAPYRSRAERALPREDFEGTDEEYRAQIDAMAREYADEAESEKAEAEYQESTPRERIERGIAKPADYVDAVAERVEQETNLRPFLSGLSEATYFQVGEKKLRIAAHASRPSYDRLYGAADVDLRIGRDLGEATHTLSDSADLAEVDRAASQMVEILKKWEAEIEAEAESESPARQSPAAPESTSPLQRIEDNAQAGFINLDLVTFGLASRLAPRPEDTSGPVSKKLIRSVRAAQHKLDMPDWRFRQILKRETGKTSTKDLTQHEAQRLIDSLIARGVESLGLSRTLFNAVKVIHSPAWWLKRSAAGEKMYQSAEDHWFEQIRLRDQLAKWWQKANAGLSKAEINRIGLYRDTKQLLDHYGDPERVARILERAGEDPAILDDLEGYLSPELKAVSDRWSEIFEWTRKKGVEAGFLKPEQKIETYLPFYYDSFFQRHPERIKDAAVDLAQELGIPTHYAEQILKQANPKNVKVGSFDLERLLWLLPGMRDPNQRFEIYSKGFARKMAVTGFLREANKLYPKIQDPHIRELAHEYINQYAGRPASSQSYQWGRIAGILTGLQYTAKIGFNLWSPLLNLTQTVINTVPQVGLTRTAVMIPRAMMATLLPAKLNPFVRDIVRLQRAGILDTFSAKFERPKFHGVAESVQEAAGFLFDKTEQINRSIAFLAGLEQARARGLKGEAAVKHARSVVRITQFFSGRLDAPLFARTPIGKVLMQFKTFTFKEIEFIRQLDWKQQVKFVVATIALGGPAAFLILQALQRFWPDDDITKLAEELQESYNVAAFLQAEQLTRQLGVFTIPGLEDLGGWEFGNRILSWAAGPTINSFIQTAQDAGRWVADPEGSNRASMTPAERFVTTLIRSWMPGGTEILRVKRAMDEADSPQEALRILINAAGPAGSRKASADAVAFGVESEALVY